MKRIIKDLYTQFLLITVGVLIGNGVILLIYHLKGEVNHINWYFPFSCVITGLLSALPGLIFYIEKINYKLRIVLHFLLLLVALALSSLFAGWFDSLRTIIEVLVTFVFIYIAVWVSILLIYNEEANQINDALKEHQDIE